MEEVAMQFKKIAMVLFACLVLGAVAANAAQAEQWTVENAAGVHETLAGPEPIKCVKHGTTNFELTTTLLGVPIKISAKGIDCEEFTIDTLLNDPVMGGAHSKGFLNLTEVKVE